jgi:large subunit ribosomal protein L21
VKKLIFWPAYRCRKPTSIGGTIEGPVMYAIVSEGGRQYKVEEGQVLNLDYRDLATGETLTLDQVLFIGGDGGQAKLGKPLVAGASVTAEVVGLKQGDKLYIQKMRRRKNFRRRTGHRQMYTQVKISQINA